MDHLHYTGNTKKTCGSKGTECSAMNCTKYTKTNKEVAFHSFPKDDARCAEWIRNLRREDLLGKTPDQMKWRRVCSDHFATSQFKNPNDRKSGLLPNSVPWLIDCPDPPKSGDVRRKQPHDRGRSAPVEGRDSSSMNEVKKELGNGCDGSMKIEEIYIKEELIEPEQEPSNTEDRRGEKRRAHSRSRSPDSKKQRPEVEEARVEDKPEYDRSKVLLDCYAGDFELEPDHDEQYEEEEEDPDAPDPDSARENEPLLELEPGQVKEELGNEYDSFMYSEEIDIKEELIEPKLEPSHTEDIQGEKRRAHSRSCSPDSKKQRPEVEEVRVEDEPEYDKSAVLLDWYNRDLSLIIDKETFLSAKPMTSDGSAYVWHGVRARYGFLHGHLFYEVKVEDHLAVPHLEGEQHPYGLRCGWSIGDAEMTLGEEPFSYGYGGTAEASTNLKFKDYGQPLKKGDVIGCFLDMDSRPITMSFSVNGRNFGKCYEVFHRSLRGKALFPHILTKNCAFKVNFGSEYPWFQPMARYTFVGQIPLEERVLGSQEPQTRQDSEISNMNPSSFYGHGYEAGIPDESEDENLESENDDDEYEPEKDSEIQISEDETEDDEGTEEEDYPSTCTKGKKISRKPVWKTKKSEDVDSLEKDFTGQVYAGDGSVRSPIEYFEELLDSSMKKLLVEESNKYAIQNDPNKPLNLTMDELEKFIGMLYIMSIVKIPRARLYWSSYLRFPKIADVMSLQRFETIKKNLHCNDNQSRPDGCQDKLYKIRPILDMITSKVSSTSPAEKLCIDEQMVPFKGTSSMKTYNPKKPKKWGYKIFVLSGTNGLVYNFKIYAGNISPVPGQPDLKASGNIVLDLLQPIPKGMWHKVYFGHWFNSPLLQTTLWKQGFGSLGTVRLNRVSGCNMPSDTQMKHLGCGTSVIQVTQMDDVELRVVKWYDNQGVTLLSNFAAVEPQRTVQRWNSKEKKYVDIACPSIIMMYNKFMGGVDLLDSLLALYRIGLRSKKWYHKFLWHFLDVMLIQAWLLYIRDFDLSGALKKDKLPLLKFKLEVSDCLLLKGKVRGPKRGRPSVNVDDLYRAKAKKGPTVKIPAKPIRTDMIGHFPEFAEKKGRCKYPGCTGTCKVFCCKCRVNLCFTPKSNCFQKFHM